MNPKARSVMTAALAVTFAFGATALAQPGSDGDGDRVDRAGKMEKVKHLRGKLLRGKVGLDDARAAQVEEILDANREDHRALRQEVRAQTRALRALVESDSDDQSAYAEAIAALKAAKDDMRALRAAKHDQLAELLSPREQATLMLTMKRVKGHMHRRGKKGLRGDRRERGKHGWRGKKHERRERGGGE